MTLNSKRDMAKMLDSSPSYIYFDRRSLSGIVAAFVLTTLSCPPLRVSGNHVAATECSASCTKCIRRAMKISSETYMSSAALKFVAKAAGSVLVLALLLVSSAYATPSSKNRKVHEMLALMRMEETTNRLEQAQETHLRATAEQELAGATLDPDQRKSFEELQRKLVHLLRETTTWKALEPDLVKLYSDAYTEKEIDGILVFYRSPAGRAMLAKAGDLTARSIAISQRRMAGIAPKIQEAIDQFVRDTL